MAYPESTEDNQAAWAFGATTLSEEGGVLFHRWETDGYMSGRGSGHKAVNNDILTRLTNQKTICQEKYHHII